MHDSHQADEIDYTIMSLHTVWERFFAWHYSACYTYAYRGVARILSTEGLDSVGEACETFAPWPRPLIRIM